VYLYDVAPHNFAFGSPLWKYVDCQQHWVGVLAVPAGSCTFDVSGLSPSKYRVSLNANEGLTELARVEFTVAAGGTIPAAPSGLTASAVSASQINLTWSDNASNETGYVVERCQTAACTFTAIATLGANVTSYNNNTGLTPSTSYSYRVAASNGAGTSGYSNTASATTGAASGLQLAVTGYKVKGMQHADLTWSGATSANVDIYRNSVLITTTPNDSAHTDVINLRGGGSYTYRVCQAGTATCSSNVTITF
jgi:predicted phage tail protein